MRSMKMLKVTLAGSAVFALQGCIGLGPLDVVPHDADETTMALAQVADDLEAVSQDRIVLVEEVDEPVEFIGRGFSQVSGQPGGTLNERRLMAIRAARMEAYRDLTEQVHGLRITSQTTMRDAILRDDQIHGMVEGEIRGARTVSVNPLDSDSFEVVLSLSPDTVRYILRAARAGI